MRWLIHTVFELMEDVEFWLPALGLLLIGAGILMALLHFFGGKG
jgi:hypothetical protein